MRQWKNISGFEGQYQVSDDGFVRSLPDIDSRGRFMTGQILKHRVTEKGYAVVNLRHTPMKVHRLVATAFVDGEGPQVNHKDGDKLNNHASNLEWCTNADNQTHRHRVLGQPAANTGKRGIACPNSKPVVARSVATGAVVGVYGSAAEAGRERGISGSGVLMCINGKLRSFGRCTWARITRDQYRELTGG